MLVQAQNFKLSGVVQDGETGDPMIGAAIILKENSLYAVSGLDGSFSIRNIPAGVYEVEISFISYKTQKQSVNIDKNTVLNVKLQPDQLMLNSFEVIETRDLSSESSARSDEKTSASVLNIISAKSIEVSPDITVANVVQRISGLTIERNNNGDGQYAIVRGMDKRYNYTLVNGVKIPSPDNENRYIPLDIFPAELLDRLVVSKSLTPDMEGDAIGGVVDMKMKNAPEKKQIKASITTGYSEIFMNRPYDYFDVKSVDRLSPKERAPANSVVAGPEYFSKDNFNFEERQALPNVFASLSLGNRYRDGKLGVIVAGSYQNSFRGADRVEFGISDGLRDYENKPEVVSYQQRRYSVQQERAGVHTKVDYQINSANKISFYNVFLHLQNNESRIIQEDELRGLGLPTLEYNLRGQVNIQQIYNSTLQGEHGLAPGLTFDWSAVFAVARQEMPDNSQLVNVSNFQAPDFNLRWIPDENQDRIWEKNSDRDVAAYYNLTYDKKMFGTDVELKTGGLVRIKNRENFFDRYTFKPNPGVQDFEPFVTDFNDLTWRITGAAGTPTHVLNYTSYENIFAHYGQFKFLIGNTQFLGGLRAEYTDQGYDTKDLTKVNSSGNQEYWSFLPSFHVKHMPTQKINLRASYFRSISRPSFLEIIPYRRPGGEELVARGGNPGLVAVDAHNFDARFEFFPNALDQVLIGAFYKQINNPLEFAIILPTDERFPSDLPPRRTLIPINFEVALNRGIEMDFIKYFGLFGIRANYTFTDSDIESQKRSFQIITEKNYDQLSDLQKESLGIGDTTFLNITQPRPLQGQSRHLGNLSLLFKDQKRGIDAQLSGVYTGERIAFVSTGFETDWWQKAFIQLDFSFEKRFKNGISVFGKATNLLNTPFEMYVKRPHAPKIQLVELQPNSSEETLVRQDLYNRMYLLGIKFNLQ